MRTPIKPVTPDAKNVMKNYQQEKAKKYGIQHIEPTQPKWFVSYPFIIAIMAVLQVCTTLYGRRYVEFFGFQAGQGLLILLPMVIYLFQIVAECYGWQYARQVVWCNFVVNMLLVAITFSFKFVPISSFTHANLKLGYTELIDTMWIPALTNWFTIFFSDFVSSALMCWSRFYWNGKFMAIRMVILHCVGEIVLLSGAFIVLPYYGYSTAETWHIIYTSFIARTILCIILLPVARFVIWFIQHNIEGVVVFDYKADFNPFKFGINPTDSVQFNADGWDTVDVGKVNLKQFSEYHAPEILKEQHQKQMEEFNNRQYG
jgi:uncharacterized PurR-regulated membrane protein YhhQ (DUF165 family)